MGPRWHRGATGEDDGFGGLPDTAAGTGRDGPLPGLRDDDGLACRLKPAQAADTVEIIGAALLAHAQGERHRPIAKRLDVPEETVRGWLRRARSIAERLRVQATVIAHDFDPELAPIDPTRSAVEAIGTAAAAIRRRLGHDRAAWPTIVAFTHGRLLAPPLGVTGPTSARP